MGIEKNIEEMIRRSLAEAPLQSFTEPKEDDCYIASKEKGCATCKYGRNISDGKGGFTVYCKHPKNTRETNYKYATECLGESLNRYKHWEPDCDMEEIKMEEIKIGDIYKRNGFDICVAVISCRLRKLDERIQIDLISDDGSAIYTTDDYISKNYHKIGHIEKFAEALKELQGMAENVER